MDVWEQQKVVERATEGVDVKKANEGDAEEQRKFRENITKIMLELFQLSSPQKRKALEALKGGAFSLMSQIPVITPVITAMLQTITTDDLGERMDRGFRELGEKMDRGFRELGEKMDEGFNRMEEWFKKMDEQAEKRHREVIEWFKKMDEQAERRHKEAMETMRLIARLTVEESERTRRELLQALSTG